MINFDVNKKALDSMSKEALKQINTLEAFNAKTKSTVEAAGANVSSVVSHGFSHPLVEAAHTAFQSHYPLVLTPDSIWLTIEQGLANHINANAEALRDKFVSHQGKELIMIQRDYFVKGSPDNDWPGAFAEFSEKLSKYIGKKRDLIVSNFSTTGAIERAASEVVLMDSMKSYFKYACRTYCGIPKITLTGTTEDWKNIKARVQNISEFNLNWWTSSLEPVIDQFVAASEGNVDVKFWDELYKVEGGSGGPYASGWINNFFPYLIDYRGNTYKNKYFDLDRKNRFFNSPTLDVFPQGLSKVPFKWEYHGVTHDMEFLGGMVGIHQNEVNLSVTPAIGWAIRDTGIMKEGPIDPKEDW